MYKISNLSNLEFLLKEITKNSVLDAKKKILNEDDIVKSFSKRSKEEIEDLLGEQEEEEELPPEEEAEEEEEEVPPEEEAGDTAEDEEEPAAEPEEEVEKKNPAAEKTKTYDEYGENFDASFQDIKDAINILRAGKSLKGKDTSQELNDYYEILDKNEREVLLLFLRELSKILTGAIDGDEGQDPSGAKAYYNIEKINKAEKDLPQEQTEEAEEDVDLDLTKQKTQTPVSSGDDTSPPIRVNESQDFTKLKKVRG